MRDLAEPPRRVLMQLEGADAPVKSIGCQVCATPLAASFSGAYCFETHKAICLHPEIVVRWYCGCDGDGPLLALCMPGTAQGSIH